MDKSNPFAKISFTDIISKYVILQSKVVSQIKFLASSLTSAAPGKFLLVQFSMSQVTQIGESISNMIQQVNTVINNAVRNQSK
ncbi:MAG: hypothetical protein A2888_01455 [Chlamydiae bacterium RIFCSPLOWO2_01_FULL_28_7]|nr:MAG: hypothetical protein A2888_01455 [Chlamydiae bacterium RIFCSPLOWO2_01_FULL_28_7]